MNKEEEQKSWAEKAREALEAGLHGCEDWGDFIKKISEDE